MRSLWLQDHDHHPVLQPGPYWSATPMTAIRLTVLHRVLHFPRGGINYDANPVEFDCPDTPSLLVRYYDSGDCDTIAWPIPRRSRKRHLTNLEFALREEQLTNPFFPANSTIELPDGTAFTVPAAPD
jgi:hypothetical protein